MNGIHHLFLSMEGAGVAFSLFELLFGQVRCLHSPPFDPHVLMVSDLLNKPKNIHYNLSDMSDKNTYIIIHIYTLNTLLRFDMLDMPQEGGPWYQEISCPHIVSYFP